MKTYSDLDPCGKLSHHEQQKLNRFIIQPVHKIRIKNNLL